MQTLYSRTQVFLPSFHLLIKGWTDSKSPFVGEKTVSLLERMRTTSKNPSLVTFRLVLEALVHTSKDRCSGVAQAETILRNIDSKAVDREHSLRPNAKLANMVLQGKHCFIGQYYVLII
jgi:hypothetical protein